MADLTDTKVPTAKATEVQMGALAAAVPTRGRRLRRESSYHVGERENRLNPLVMGKMLRKAKTAKQQIRGSTHAKQGGPCSHVFGVVCPEGWVADQVCTGTQGVPHGLPPRPSLIHCPCCALDAAETGQRIDGTTGRLGN